VVGLAFLDLRFADGHVERWLGPAGLTEMPGGADAIAALQAWAREVVGGRALDIMRDIACHHDVPSTSIIHALGCDEIVIEWHRAPMPT
jgi:hypothetical protein